MTLIIYVAVLLFFVAIGTPISFALLAGRHRARHPDGGGHHVNKVAGGVLPFLVAQTGVLALLVIFPDIVMVPLRWMTQ